MDNTKLDNQRPDLGVGLDGGLELADVGTNNGLDLLTVLEEQKGGHGGDAVLLCDIGALLDVDLDEVSSRDRLGELVDNGGNHLAGAAPGGVKVDNGKTGEGDFLVEIREGLNLLDHFWGGCAKEMLESELGGGGVGWGWT